MGKNRNKRSKLAKQQFGKQNKQSERQEKRKQKRKKQKEDEQKYLDDMKRFREELIQYGLTIIEVGGDGNCLFRSICDQLEGNQLNHKQYRIDAVDYMQQNKEDFMPFIEDDVTFDDYIDNMDTDGEWGGNLEIQAISMKHQFNVIVHQLDDPIYCVTNFDPNVVRTIHLTYHMGEHYNSVRLLEDGNTNEPPMPIPLTLKKDPQLLDNYHEKKDKKMKNDAKRFKEKHKQQNGKQESSVVDEYKTPTSDDENIDNDDSGKMDIQKDPRIVQYACTILGMPDYHIMKQALESVFDAQNPSKLISFEDIETRRIAIEEQYSNFEMGILTGQVEDIEISKTFDEEDKDNGGQSSGAPTPDEIMQNVKKGKIYTPQGKWIRPPNRNKKCYCNSKNRYKLCCLPKDKKRLDDLINGKDHTKKMFEQDSEAKDFLSSLICI